MACFMDVVTFKCKVYGLLGFALSMCTCETRPEAWKMKDELAKGLLCRSVIFQGKVMVNLPPNRNFLWGKPE